MGEVVGPFTQLIVSPCEVIEGGAFRVNDGRIEEVFQGEAPSSPAVCFPGFIDSHTHICWAGSRVADYAARLSGVSYQKIAARGGGILDTVRHTRAATLNELAAGVVERAKALYTQGVRTVEVKSGYCLDLEGELKMLRAIQKANQVSPVDLIPTCLAAHTLPPEFSDQRAYLEMLVNELLPQVWEEGLSKRVDIFVEKEAFSVDNARWYLEQAKKIGFTLTLHADQFTRGAALLAAEVGAISADHLEVSGEEEGKALARSGCIATVLPGATLGLGLPFPPARALIDAGATVAIATDWNPGSGPMGHLLMQTATLGAAEKLSMEEQLAGITTNAASALGLTDRGTLAPGYRADYAVFPITDWRELFYRQGAIATACAPEALQKTMS